MKKSYILLLFIAGILGARLHSSDVNVNVNAIKSLDNLKLDDLKEQYIESISGTKPK